MRHGSIFKIEMEKEIHNLNLGENTQRNLVFEKSILVKFHGDRIN